MNKHKLALWLAMDMLRGKKATPWYLVGGMALEDWVAVYQPRGASNLDASYLNLAIPGTNDATPEVAPTFATAKGWIGDGTKVLRGPNMLTVQSVIVKYSDNISGGTKSLIGQFHSTGMLIQITSINNNVLWANCSTAKTTTSAPASGVLAIVGAKTYIDGIVDVSDLAVGARQNYLSYIMATDNWSGPEYGFVGNIEAVGFSSALWTDAQVAEMSTALNF